MSYAGIWYLSLRNIIRQTSELTHTVKLLYEYYPTLVGFEFHLEWYMHIVITKHLFNLLSSANTWSREKFPLDCHSLLSYPLLINSMDRLTP